MDYADKGIRRWRRFSQILGSLTPSSARHNHEGTKARWYEASRELDRRRDEVARAARAICVICVICG